MNLAEFKKQKIEEEKQRRKENIKCYEVIAIRGFKYAPSLLFMFGKRDNTMFVYPGKFLRSINKIKDYKNFLFKTFYYNFPYETSIYEGIWKIRKEIKISKSELKILSLHSNHFQRWINGSVGKL